VNDHAARTDDAIALLRALSGPHGIRASASNHANYAAVFTRDAVMAGIAGLLIGDDAVSQAFVRTLVHLRNLQGPEGQIASNYEFAGDAAPRVSFGTMVPRLDAGPWYVIGVALAARAGIADGNAFRESVRLVVRLLDALEYNGRHLVYVPAGGDWADEYIYEGYVLHDQVLRAWGLRLAGDVFDEPSWREKSTLIEATILREFWPPEQPERRYPLAAVSPTRAFDIFDLATCSLLGVSGIAGRLADSSLEWIDETFLSRAALPPAFHPVIEEGDADWPALSRYHLHGFRNRPHEYHNGGVWMIWLGWLALALARTQRNAPLARLGDAVDAQLTAHGAFAFDEYFHGLTGEPGGTRHMAYSATGLLFTRIAREPHRLSVLLR
jgi:hypothetical protein